MNTQDQIKATGSLKIVVRGADGAVKDEHEVKNLVVNSGLAFIASRMAGTSAAVMSHMAIGAGTANAAAGDTTLGLELGRVALTSTTVTANSVAYAATFGPGVATGAVTEAGIFNDGAAGTMLCRTKFNVVNKDVGDTMAITWTVTVA